MTTTFAYWAKVNHGKLTQDEVESAARFALHLEDLTYRENGPKGPPIYAILGALAFAHARTLDVREYRGDLPVNVFLPTQQAGYEQIVMDTLDLWKTP